MAKAELYVKNDNSWVNYNLLNAYPVGAIYVSGSSTSPASLFGGSWTQITNAALRGATSVGYTGSDSHTLSANEMPKHRHISDGYATGDYWLGYNSYGDTTTAAGVAYSNLSNQYSIKVSSKITTSKLSEFRGGGQHIPTCNAPTTVTCGNAKAKSPRGDVAWPTSTLDKLCTQLEHISSQTIQPVLPHYLEELGQLSMREDSSVPQVVDTMLAHKVERVLLLCPQLKCQHILTECLKPLRMAELLKVIGYYNGEINLNQKVIYLLIVRAITSHMKTDHYLELHTYGEEQLSLTLGCDA